MKTVLGRTQEDLSKEPWLSTRRHQVPALTTEGRVFLKECSLSLVLMSAKSARACDSFLSCAEQFYVLHLKAADPYGWEMLAVSGSVISGKTLVMDPSVTLG